MTVFYDRQSVLVTDQTFTIDDDLYDVDAIDGVLVNPRRVGRVLRFVALLLPVPLAAVGYASAVAVIMLVISLVFALLYQRFVLRRDIEGALTTMGT